MTGGLSGEQKAKEVHGSDDPNSLPVAHAGEAQKVGEPNRFGLEVIASESIPPGEAHLVSANGSRVVIKNIARNKEG